MIRMRTLGLIITAMMMGSYLPAAHAAEAGYVAMLDKAAPQDRLVAHGLLWRCTDARCVAAAGNSRPAIVCEALAKAVGPLASFTSGNDTLAPETLARCNAAAQTPRHIAAQ